MLGIPDAYQLGIVPASDTGAVEMALWSLLGERGVDVLAWESFSSGWAADCKNQLQLKDLRILKADYGKLPDLDQVDWARDVVFAWNGTTSGVRVPNGYWIAADRPGLTICDATSAVFAMEIPWDKLDVVTWSWQKVLGGEGAHGMIALSPRAVQRLETFTPNRPLPKIFQMTKGGKLIEGIFQGETINTPSMLCVEDALDGLKWAESIGGLPALHRPLESEPEMHRRLGCAVRLGPHSWPKTSPRAPALPFVSRSRTRSSPRSPPTTRTQHVKSIVSTLEKERAAYDIGAYRDAPVGLRIWGGATVETSDIQALLPWLDWAYGQTRAAFAPTHESMPVTK